MILTYEHDLDIFLLDIHAKIQVRKFETDYEILLVKANMDSLDLYIQKVILVEIYKAVTNIGATYLSDLFTLNKNNTRCWGLDLVLPRLDSATYSFIKVPWGQIMGQTATGGKGDSMCRHLQISPSGF